MAELNELTARVHRFLSRHIEEAEISPPPAAAAAFAVVMMEDMETRSRAELPFPAWGFSHFVVGHVEEALRLADAYMNTANRMSGQAGFEAVMDQVEQDWTIYDPELVKYALMVFMTHHDTGRLVNVRSLVERAPEKVLPSSAPMGPTLTTRATMQPQGATPPEDRLDWYREDPLANEHHEHWHIVYPIGGVPDGNGNFRTKDRQGELFLYMHQQMLARYDTERMTAGLGPVIPFKDYRDPIPEGYNPGLLYSENFREGYGARQANTAWSDVRHAIFGIFYAIFDHEQRRDRMFDAAESGYLRRGDTFAEATADSLGATEESTIDSISVGGSGRRSSLNYYGNHHGMGHVLTALSTEPDGPPEGQPPRPGVMYDTATAIRDPFFYRWHRHVDDLGFRWQQTLPPHDLSDAPQVLLRQGLDPTTMQPWSPDIILCLRSDIPGTDAPNFDGQALGEYAFGNRGRNQNWNRNVVQGEHTFDHNGQALTITTRDELRTHMHSGKLVQRDGSEIDFPFLNHDEFYYFIRVQNHLNRPQDVTVRLFLVLEASAENRRMWIEMDKFRHQLSARERAVIFRPGELSSVIRKPAIKDPSDVQQLPQPDPQQEPDYYYCTCGWPYHLLLPRGTTDGMRFRLMVMVTDWQLDQVGPDSHCGSMSYCGARDRYPDNRPMGYPFDRPFAVSIADTIAMQQNMAWRPLTIRFTDEA